MRVFVRVISFNSDDCHNVHVPEEEKTKTCAAVFLLYMSAKPVTWISNAWYYLRLMHLRGVCCVANSMIFALQKFYYF